MQARSLLFTIYGDFILRYGQEMWIGSLIKGLAEFGIQAPAVRMAVSRTVQEGLLRALTEEKKGFYTLTEKGRSRLEEGIRRVYRQQAEPWDGQWRVVTFEPPDDRRDLRERIPAELEWRGFGQLSGCTWVSPHRLEESIRQMMEDYGLQGHLHLFTARYGGAETDRDLAARCWDLSEIIAKYRDFNDEVQSRIDRFRGQFAAGQEVPDTHCFVERVWLVHEWRKFLHFDPDLPAELLPLDWPGALPRQLFWEYYRLLSSGAERFFLELCRQPVAPAALAVVAEGRYTPKNDTAELASGTKRKRRPLLRQDW